MSYERMHLARGEKYHLAALSVKNRQREQIQRDVEQWLEDGNSIIHVESRTFKDLKKTFGSDNDG